LDNHSSESSSDENTISDQAEQENDGLWIDYESDTEVRNLKFWVLNHVADVVNFPENLTDEQTKGPLTYFILLFDDTIFTDLTDWTNNYMASCSLKDQQFFSKFWPHGFTKVDIAAHLAFVQFQGIVKLNQLQSY